MVVLVLEVQGLRADTRAYAFGMNPSTDSGGERKRNNKVTTEMQGGRRKEIGIRREKNHGDGEPLRAAGVSPLDRADWRRS